MNNSTDKNLDSNLERAYYMSETQMTHDEIVNLLKNGNVAEKQIAALKFDKISSAGDAKQLLFNLTGCDGKIREAIAYKLNKILINDKAAKGFIAPIAAKKFADSTIDINANICRYTVDNAVLLKNDKNFSKEYVMQILKYTEEAFSEIDKFIFRDKKYVINKQIFKLYWCLEALAYFYEYVERDVLFKIIKKASEMQEYTIREKAAKIVLLSGDFSELKTKFESDENYYVRNVFS